VDLMTLHVRTTLSPDTSLRTMRFQISLRHQAQPLVSE
jgi:hypothetical protein